MGGLYRFKGTHKLPSGVRTRKCHKMKCTACGHVMFVNGKANLETHAQRNHPQLWTKWLAESLRRTENPAPTNAEESQRSGDSLPNSSGQQSLQDFDSLPNEALTFGGVFRIVGTEWRIMFGRRILRRTVECLLCSRTFTALCQSHFTAHLERHRSKKPAEGPSQEPANGKSIDWTVEGQFVFVSSHKRTYDRSNGRRCEETFRRMECQQCKRVLVAHRIHQLHDHLRIHRQAADPNRVHCLEREDTHIYVYDAADEPPPPPLDPNESPAFAQPLNLLFKKIDKRCRVDPQHTRKGVAKWLEQFHRKRAEMNGNQEAGKSGQASGSDAEAEKNDSDDDQSDSEASDSGNESDDEGESGEAQSSVILLDSANDTPPTNRAIDMIELDNSGDEEAAEPSGSSAEIMGDESWSSMSVEEKKPIPIVDFNYPTIRLQPIHASSDNEVTFIDWENGPLRPKIPNLSNSLPIVD